MKKILLLLVFIFISHNSFSITAEEMAKDASDAMQKILPMKIDLITELVEVSNRGNFLNYQYTVGMTLEEYKDMGSGFDDEIKQDVTNQNCSSTLIKRMFFNNGVKIRHTYFDMRDEHQLLSFIVDKNSCK